MINKINAATMTIPGKEAANPVGAAVAPAGRGASAGSIKAGETIRPTPQDAAIARLRERGRRDAKWQKSLLAAAVLAVLGFVTLIYLPSVRRLQAMHARIQAGAVQLDAEEQQARRLPAVIGAADRLEEHLDKFKPLPDRPLQAQFLRNVSSVAQRLRLRNMQFQPLAGGEFASHTPEAPVYELPVRLEFRGDFVNVFNFLRQVEELPRLLRVRDVRIRRVDSPGLAASDVAAVEGEGSADVASLSDVQVEMTVSLFYQAAGSRATFASVH